MASKKLTRTQHRPKFYNSRRLIGTCIDKTRRLISLPGRLIRDYFFLKKLESENFKFEREISFDDFLSSKLITKTTKALWNSTLEDKFLKKNSIYEINKRTGTLVFEGRDNNNRWLSVKECIAKKKLLLPEDTVIDLGCSTGGLVNGLAFVFGCRAVGIDINPDKSIEYAKKFRVRNAYFKVFSIQDLFKLKFKHKFKIILFTYQSHGDIRWLKNTKVQLDFFNWIKNNGEYLLMNDPRGKMPMPNWFRETATLQKKSFNPNYPLKIYKT